MLCVSETGDLYVWDLVSIVTLCVSDTGDFCMCGVGYP